LLQELYERLVQAERLRAEAEKQRGDDLSKIAMMLASSKNGECSGVTSGTCALMRYAWNNTVLFTCDRVW
jgi:hypothetical protein